MVVSLACLSTLLTWLAVLATSRGARLWLGEHRRGGAILLAFLAVIGGIFPYQQLSQWLAAQREARLDASLNRVLNQPTRLAGVDMPAGTVLRVAAPDDLASFDRATFPDGHLASVQGLSATRLFHYPATARQPETLSVEIARDQAQDGWLCGHGHRVEFVMLGGKPHFASCHLAIGNTLNQQPVPAGVWLKVDDAARATAPDPASPAPRWRLNAEGSDPFTVAGMPLLKVDMTLDAQRRLLTFEGLLARESTLGAITYPTGTRMLTAGPRVPGVQAGDLLFSPSRGRSARQADGKEIAAGMSVLQAPDGTVRSILSNRDAGVLDVASMRTAP